MTIKQFEQIDALQDTGVPVRMAMFSYARTHYFFCKRNTLISLGFDPDFTNPNEFAPADYHRFRNALENECAEYMLEKGGEFQYSWEMRNVD